MVRRTKFAEHRTSYIRRTSNIRTSDIYNSEVDQFPDFYISKEIYEEINQDLQSGDILYTNDGKIGLVAMMTPQDKCIIQSHIKRIRLNQEAKLKHKLTEEYLFLVLSLKEIGGFQAKLLQTQSALLPGQLWRQSIDLPDIQQIEALIFWIRD